MAAPAYSSFLISDSGSGGYGIAQNQAKEKSLLGLPMLAAATLAGVVFLLGALPRLSSTPLSSSGETCVRFYGPDGGGGVASFSFLKALSCSLAVSLELVFGDVGRLASSACLPCSGLSESSCVVSSVRAEHPLSSTPGAMLTPPCICAMCCTLICTHSNSFYYLYSF